MERKTKKRVNRVRLIVESAAKFGFKPNKDFYNAVEINQKRWPLLLEGKKEPSITELLSICEYFGVKATDFISL